MNGVPGERRIVIIGAGGHAASVADVATAAGFDVRGFVSPNDAGKTLLGRSVVAALDEIASDCGLCVAIGDNALREKLVRDFAHTHAQMNYPVIVHPSAVISPYARLGAGSVVHAGAFVGPGSVIGAFCIVNTHASLDHDGVMGDYASLGPRAVTGGCVAMGERTAVAIGAVVKHGVRLGRDCVLGANSYLDKDIPDNALAYGTPARIVRSRETGAKYL